MNSGGRPGSRTHLPNPLPQGCLRDETLNRSLPRSERGKALGLGQPGCRAEGSGAVGVWASGRCPKSTFPRVPSAPVQPRTARLETSSSRGGLRPDSVVEAPGTRRGGSRRSVTSRAGVCFLRRSGLGAFPSEAS